MCTLLIIEPFFEPNTIKAPAEPEKQIHRQSPIRSNIPPQVWSHLTIGKMCLLLLPLLCKKRKNAQDNGPSPRPVPVSQSGGGVGIGREGRRYREDMEKYGPEVAEQNRKRRVGIVVAA